MNVLSVSGNLSNSLYGRLFSELLNSHNVNTLAFDPFQGKTYEFSKANTEIFAPRPSKAFKKSYFDKLFPMNISRGIAFAYADYVCNVDLMHAHTLSYDAEICHEIFKKTAKPFCVTIRNTDINYVLRYKYHLRSHYSKIILNSRRILFPNACYRDRFIEYFCPSVKRHVIANSCFVPNSIDPLFFCNGRYSAHLTSSSTSIHIVHVSNCSSNKNLVRALKALALIPSHTKIKISIVGLRSEKISKFVNTQFSRFDPVIYPYLPQKRLVDLYLTADILLNPSIHETFGLVYFEALSQGLSIIYSRREGVDDMVQSPFAFSCNPKSIPSIASALMQAIEMRPAASTNYPQLKELLLSLYSPKAAALKLHSVYSQLV